MKKNLIEIETIVLKNKNCDFSILNNDLVTFDIEKGLYFSINDIGSDIWNHLDTPIKVSSLIDGLMEIYSVDRETCVKDVLSFLNELYNLKIIDKV